MGTQGTGRKRAPVKDRFSAEDEALSSIAREAEARLAAKRAARAEARDIRMRELERQQKEHSYHSSGSSNRKWGQIHQWMADSEKARTSSSSRSSSRPHRGLDDDVMSVRSYRSTSSAVRDLGSSLSRSSSRRKDALSDSLSTSSALRSSRSTVCTRISIPSLLLPSFQPFDLLKLPFFWAEQSSVYNDLHGHKKASSSSSKKDLLTGLYHDQRNYTSLTKNKAPPSTSSYQPPPSTSTSTYQPRATTSSSSTTGTGLSRSHSMASICDDTGLYVSGYSSRAPSEYSCYSSCASSTRSSPASSSDDDTVSSVSQERFNRGRRDSVLDEKCDKQYTDYSRPSSRCATPSLSAATLASLGGTSSRRGSTDTGSVYDADTSLSELRDIYELKDQIQDVEGRYMQGLKELKESLAEVEEKYKKAMVSNAQLDNDKNNLIYQVDTLKDVIEEMEEQTSEMRRELEEKSKELERQKHTCTVLQHKQEELKEGIRQRDELIEALERQKEYFDCIRNERDELRDELADIKEKAKAGEKHGLVIIPEGTPNGDVNHEPLSSGITVVSQEAAQVLESAGDGPLDVRLRKLAEEKDELLAQIRKLKNQLEEERQKHSKVDSTFTDGERMENGTDLHFIEMQRDANRQISEFKFKLSKAEQEMGTMEQNINRLEGQVSRYKSASDNSEKIEDELKAEKRRLQRELRTALDKNEEMEMTNNHLVKRLEKMKANRNALLSQQ
ncbi:leucine-rich repeat flightless-interacting protein 2 isoform X11 [Pleuronectes platessa]|uniref:leucine-rich repeat flightless-interacting protein 2 isoform X11 n=1 Tax=Pleuronectes platessa TaxID=8262 RepID=UPI00232A07D1|nr:leucine-rich repeat flightless-interacting protein 2 isoform X11 [Pleuronectes platessa]